VEEVNRRIERIRTALTLTEVLLLYFAPQMGGLYFFARLYGA
jgi:hypothetical protein